MIWAGVVKLLGDRSFVFSGSDMSVDMLVARSKHRGIKVVMRCFSKRSTARCLGGITGYWT